MKIWHVGDFSAPHRVDGVASSGWVLAGAQAGLGHDVSLVIGSPADSAAVETAAETGMRLVQTSKSVLRFGEEVGRILARQAPDVVHMHSVFIPQQAAMARTLRQRRIPYVITPHAGLAPQVLQRGMMKKWLYGMLVERPRFMAASAIAIVTPGEERAVRAYLPDFARPIRWIPNPIAVDSLGPLRWQGLKPQPGPKRISFLGRFDVLHKGIDILIEIARLLPELQFDLYGADDARTRDWLDRLKRNLPANVAFHNPIFGSEKGKVLAESCLYVQSSRWEGFPVSVAECLYMGVPCALAETLDLAQLYRQHNLGLVNPLEPSIAAARLRSAIADEARMREWSLRGQQFARTHFDPRVVAERYVALYQEAIDSGGRVQASSDGGNRGTDAAWYESNKTNGELLPPHGRGVLRRYAARMVQHLGSQWPGTTQPSRMARISTAPAGPEAVDDRPSGPNP